MYVGCWDVEELLRSVETQIGHEIGGGRGALQLSLADLDHINLVYVGDFLKSHLILQSIGAWRGL